MEYSIEDVKEICKCSCGALTVDMHDGKSYHMKPATFRSYFGVDRVPTAVNAKSPYGCCDYCVNHYGVELCACGSGKSVKLCKENIMHKGKKICGHPFEKIGEWSRYATEIAGYRTWG